MLILSRRGGGATHQYGLSGVAGEEGDGLLHVRLHLGGRPQALNGTHHCASAHREENADEGRTGQKERGKWSTQFSPLSLPLRILFLSMLLIACWASARPHLSSSCPQGQRLPAHPSILSPLHPSLLRSPQCTNPSRFQLPPIALPPPTVDTCPAVRGEEHPWPVGGNCNVQL